MHYKDVFGVSFRAFLSFFALFSIQKLSFHESNANLRPLIAIFNFIILIMINIIYNIKIYYLSKR